MDQIELNKKAAFALGFIMRYMMVFSTIHLWINTITSIKKAMTQEYPNIA
jgi:hypothetical protein